MQLLSVQQLMPEVGVVLDHRLPVVRAQSRHFPGLTILLSVLAINLMGDGLRDALDPKLKNAA